MKLDFETIIDTQNGRPAICIAHGPSLNQYVKRLEEFKRKDYILIGCNDWWLFHPEVKPHYSVMANSVFTIEKQYKFFNKYNVPIVYASSVDLTSQSFINQNLKCDYIQYDQRHFRGLSCKELMNNCNFKHLGGYDPKGQCCSHKIFTIQENLQEYTNYPVHYGTGDSVVLHQIAFSVLLGCNKVYVVGIDLDYNKGFALNIGNKSSKTVEVKALGDYVNRILKDLKIINFSANKIGTKIINLNKDSFFNVLEIGNLK